jgi:hypothetical protein
MVGRLARALGSGHWEGDTLAIDVSGQMPDSWLDSAGNFHGPNMKVQERYTPAGVNVLMYEATIADPDVFTRPWKISMPLYRRLDKNMQLLDFKCVEFVEELLYGKYRKAAAQQLQPDQISGQSRNSPRTPRLESSSL